MHTTEALQLSKSEEQEEYDDCGIAVPAEPLTNSTVEYPVTINDFMRGIYLSFSPATIEMTSTRSLINQVATAVELDAERIAADTNLARCNIHATEKLTEFFKTSFEFVAKNASELADRVQNNANILEAIAAVSALASSVMGNDEDLEEQADEELEKIEKEFEKVAEAAEIVREATADHTPSNQKLKM